MRENFLPNIEGSADDFESDIVPIAQKIIHTKGQLTDGYSMSGIFSDSDDQHSGYSITLSLVPNDDGETEDHFTLTVIQKDGKLVVIDLADDKEDTSLTATEKSDSTTPSVPTNTRPSTKVDLQKAPEYSPPEN